jgi:tetratricopeptide (TPR) repeat protein
MGRQSRGKKQKRKQKLNLNATDSSQNNLGRRFDLRSGMTVNDIKLGFEKLIFKVFGWPGLVLLFVLFVVGYVWWNWEHAKTVPFIGPALRWATQDAIPTADPTRFSIGVAHLYGDQSGYPHEQLIMEALREAQGIQVLRFDRLIEVQASQPEGGERAGHEQAQKYLSESGADVLVWGTVLSSGGQTVFKLYLTSNQAKAQGRFLPTADLALPESFWTRAKTILAFLIVAYQNQYNEGLSVANQLTSQMEKITSLLNSTDRNWEPEFRLLLRVHLAGSSAISAEQSGDNSGLENSRDLYQKLLSEVSRDSHPTLWAFLQNNLGLVFMQLAFRSGEVRKLEQAVDHFRQALLVRTREQFPMDWALTTANMGVARRFIGEYKKASSEVTLGVSYLREALKELSPRVRRAWLLTQHRLADALLEKGLASDGVEELLEANTLEEQVLKYWTAETSPMHWPRAQMTLGRINFAIGERQNSTGHLRNALALFEGLRKHYNRDANAFSWAELEYRIASTQQVLGAEDKTTAGTTRLKEAIKGLYQALEIWTPKTNLLRWLEVHERIGAALTALARREEGSRRFVEAEKAYRSALKMVPRNDMTFHWAALNYGLGMTYFWWSGKSNNPRQLCDSYIHLNHAWVTLAEHGNNLQSTQAQRAVGGVIAVFNERYPKNEFSNCLARSHSLPN